MDVKALTGGEAGDGREYPVRQYLEIGGRAYQICGEHDSHKEARKAGDRKKGKGEADMMAVVESSGSFYLYLH